MTNDDQRVQGLQRAPTSTDVERRITARNHQGFNDFTTATAILRFLSPRESLEPSSRFFIGQKPPDPNALARRC